MFTKIVVGVDDTANAFDAAALAGVLADLSGASIVLVHCHAASVSEGATELLGRVAATLARPAQVISYAGAGPAEGLAEVALKEGADLIVIGTSHRGKLEQIFVGDVTSSLLDDARCSVAIAERGAGAGEFKLDSIAVAVENAATAEVATRLGAELAQAAGVDLLRLVHVDKPAAPYAKTRSAADQAEGSIVLERALGPIGAKNAAYELRTGPPAKELVALTGEVDLVLLGPDVRDQSTSRFVSRILAHTADCSLIICKPAT